MRVVDAPSRQILWRGAHVRHAQTVEYIEALTPAIQQLLGPTRN
jgi:hypothetical protein